ncbi:hypothetical protein LXL04_005288 [Taraxacum kok-saghyz]
MKFFSTFSRMASKQKFDSRTKRCNCATSNCANRGAISFAVTVFAILMEELVAHLAHAMNVSIEFHLHYPRRFTLSYSEGRKRQKIGCNCVANQCMRILCSCVKAGVGCTNRCRCERCENVNGKRGDNFEVKSDTSLDLKLSI